MRGYLLDTNVISETAPGRAARTPAVLRLLEARTDALFVSAVTIAEIEAGIAFAAGKGARRKAVSLTEWLEALLHLYGQRVLPFGTPVARVAGKLAGRARGSGLAPGFADVAIAATAAYHELTLLTRNLRHFVPLGVEAIDPFHELAL